MSSTAVGDDAREEPAGSSRHPCPIFARSIAARTRAKPARSA